MAQFDLPFNQSPSPRPPVAAQPGAGETPAVESSEELRQVVTRFFEALRDGDEEAVRNLVSRQPGFERFGSDP